MGNISCHICIRKDLFHERADSISDDDFHHWFCTKIVFSN